MISDKAKWEALAKKEGLAKAEWLVAAERSVRECARAYREFTTAQVFKRLESYNVEYHPERLIGVIINRLAKAGVIEATDQKVKTLRVWRTTEPEGEKECRTCKTTQPHSEYYAAVGNWDGHNSQCKACERAASAQFRAANPNAFRVADRAKRQAKLVRKINAGHAEEAEPEPEKPGPTYRESGVF